jgi:two-component system sensor histidine kinase CpxA
VHSLFAKTFLWTLAIYPVSRGIGFLLLYILSVAPPFPQPKPELLQQLLPFYAEAARDSLATGHPDRLARFIAAQEAATGLSLQFAPAEQSQRQPNDGEQGDGAKRNCLSAPALTRLISSQITAVPITDANGVEYCLTAAFKPDIAHGPALPTAVLLLIELGSSAMVCFLMAGYVALPLRSLHTAALAFAGGDLSARAPSANAGRRDETAELVRAFNRMAQHISALVQAQQRFIADVSHEIKSPLARLSLAVALGRRATTPAADEHFDRLEREIDTASALVRELQVLSSLQGASSLPRQETLNLTDVMTAAIENVSFEWQGRPHRFHLSAPKQPVSVRGDKAVLQRAIENVMRNALFYTPEGTDVELTVSKQHHAAHLEVRDHGPGVPEAALPNLFEPFYRVDNSRTRNTGGIGIGLAIFARAIALHGGNAQASNATPTGLRISIELPLAEFAQATTRKTSRLSH